MIKKQRGQNRKLKQLIHNINNIAPFTNTERQYEAFAVPCGRFLSSPKTSGKIKTSFCKAFIKKSEEFINDKPQHLSFCKVVTVINTNDFWKSQIIIFYDKEYYLGFWERNTAEQAWEPIKSADRSFAKERNIKTALKEKGYCETVFEEDSAQKSILWFYGDIHA